MITYSTRKFPYRPRSWPYLSQSAFVELASSFRRELKETHVCSHEDFYIVHVNSDQLEDWVKKNLHHTCRIILITGNSDANFVMSTLLPEAVEHWFCQNTTLPQSNFMTPIPIGLEDARFGRLGLIALYRFPNRIKLNRLLIPPMSPTNKIRAQIMEEINEFHVANGLINYQSQLLPWIEYFLLARKYRFVLCLEGNGFDTHRVWETLYLGSFPVLLNTPFSETLKRMGLPVLIIDQIGDFDLDLAQFHTSKFKDFRPDKESMLWIPYWKLRIQKCIQKGI